MSLVLVDIGRSEQKVQNPGQSWSYSHVHAGFHSFIHPMFYTFKPLRSHIFLVPLQVRIFLIWVIYIIRSVTYTIIIIILVYMYIYIYTHTLACIYIYIDQLITRAEKRAFNGIRPLAVLLGFVGLMISRQMAPYLIGIVLFIAVAVAAVLMWSGSPVRFILWTGSELWS